MALALVIHGWTSSLNKWANEFVPPKFECAWYLFHCIEMDHQDWTPTVLRSKESALATTKHTGNRQTGEARHLAKIERDDFVKPKKLAAESRKDLVAARVALKLTQDQLNQRCAFPQHTIKGFEAGHLTPSGGQLNRLNSVLHTSLHLE